MALLAGAGAAALGLCYWRLRRARAAARRLQEAPKFPLDQDLKSVLLNAPGKCLPYAVVEGSVIPVNETLNSQFVDGCKGVIHRLVLKEHNAVWNRTTHLWNDCEKIIHQRTNSVPFDLLLTDGNLNITVRVTKPLESSKLDLETVYEKFHPVVQTLPNIVVHYISGERPKGITEVEQMLRAGDVVTGVGELVLDNNLIKLQPPKQGLQYYFCRLNFKSLVQKHESKVKQWKVLTVTFGIATCAAIFYILWQQYKHRKMKQEQTRQQEEKLAMKKQCMQELGLMEDEVPQNACAICLIRDRNCVFLQCGHICSCDHCYEALPIPKTCPICRDPVSRIVLLYNS
ncbi:mitochondrial ubiquitin ligase activator of NFKB 1 [Pristis pectinata]|uniref:mitochondrial ubiquitin ligase activator of NFKB 1 n=1 Tax=Pristis pectinata TaxID=685728 RepID=UPI00223E7682|nr:mitochondrial ubiquitin ligase activator of NFKB 1 [Pristis pectinata]